MRIKILVVDDEESLCEILKYNLELDGYEVDYALSGEKALTMDLSSYSLFILDIMMDKISGFDFAKRLKNNIATENTRLSSAEQQAICNQRSTCEGTRRAAQVARVAAICLQPFKEHPRARHHIQDTPNRPQREELLPQRRARNADQDGV